MSSRRLSYAERLKRLGRLLQHLRPQPLPLLHRRNRVALFPDGTGFFRALFAAIRSARHSILLEYYIVRGDATGAAFGKELAAAAARGVRVVLIYDFIGSFDTPASYFRELARQGVELLPFNPPQFRRGFGWLDKRDHRKMAIIDGYLAFLGGMNIGDEYAGRAAARFTFRDLGFSICGSAVQELTENFRESWRHERNEQLNLPALADAVDRCHGSAGVSLVSGGPHQRNSFIRNAFRVNIAAATEELLIASPYFIPGPRIIRGVLRAARRGVRVRLLLPARSDVPLVLLPGRSSYGTLLRSGVEIYELEREILHAKVMVIDGERTVIGSANLDQRSFHRNFEINCIIDSSNFGGRIRRLLEGEIAAASRVELDVHERRGMLIRVMEQVIGLFAWFL